VSGSAFQVLAILNGTAFFVLGSCLALLALTVTAVGLRDSKAFSSNAVARAGIVIFILLVLGTTAFAVRYSIDEQHDRQQKLAAEESNVAAAPAGGKQPAGQKQAAVKGPGGTLQLAADPTQIAYDRKGLSSKPGKVTIDFDNPAPIQHDVAIAQGSQEIAKSNLVSQAKTSVSAELAPGKYVFYCTVPGHRQAGMQGTLSVK
jgi:plastocyanin